MGVRSPLYYNDRLQGSISEDNCDILETIIQLKQQRGSIPSLKNTIYDLTDTDVEDIRSTGQVHPNISKDKGELTDAQTLGVGFMLSAGNCILGDSVGLGKTVQIASLLNIRHKQATDKGFQFRYLYLTEKTIVNQAVNKLVKFTRRNVYELMGDKRSNQEWREEMWDGYTGGIVAPHSIVKQQIFQSWLADQFDVADEDHYYIDYLIIDEGSIFGNTKTQMYQYAMQLKRYCKNVIILNATPFEGNLDIFYAQLDYIDNSMLNTKTAFKKRFYKMGYDYFSKYPTKTGYKNSEIFKHEIGYHYFYHTRKELGAEMKNNYYEILTRPLNDIQKELMTWTTMYGYVFDCPTLLDSTVPFDEVYVPKLEMIDVILEDHVEQEDQILIYCLYKDVQRHLKDWFEDAGFSCEILNGDINLKSERDSIVDGFVNKEYKILITSVQKGLDFGDVKNLIFYSFSTNPNKMIQMEGRITRSFNVENKNIFILAQEGRELNKLKKEVKKTLQNSADFTSTDLSGVVELLLNSLK